MELDQAKQLAELLARLQTQLTERAGGVPFQGFEAAMQTFQQGMQDIGAEIAAADARVPGHDHRREEPSPSSVPSLEQLLAGGDVCRGIDHTPALKAESLNPPDIRTPMEVVERLLILASVSKGDTVYDLGCGDGRVAVTAAANFGARAVGIDMVPERVQLARLHARLKQVEALVSFHEGNVLEANLAPATVVVLSLSKGTMLRLRDKLRDELPVGARIVAHAFDLGDWRPHRSIVITDTHGCKHRAFLWVLDERKKTSARYDEDWEFWDEWISEYQ